MNKKVKFEDLGSTEYACTWQMQKELFTSIIDVKMDNRHSGTSIPTSNYLLFTEHHPVYTLGRQGKEEHLLLSMPHLKEKGVSFFKIDRGGDITYHGPGQITAYPILDLDNFSPDIHLYVRNLEEIVIRTIGKWGIKGERSEKETGVWIDVETPAARKICAIGVRTSHWVTMHGFALNVNTDMSYFTHIIPCGIRGKGVTSMAMEVGEKINIGEVKKELVKQFCEVFGAEIE
ncbi:MAG: lipoyl(octanoyl) transferase LipB [Flavobacteriales bacterium]|nr:lipoyl(octanoyl) transferase LipB [Flavobacteriales bacterium]